MRHSVFVRAAVAGSILGATAAASAEPNFFGRTAGSFTFSDAEPPVLTGNLEQFFIAFKGPVAFDFLLMSFEITQDDSETDDLSGEFIFLGSDPANSLSGTFTGENFPNADGIWTGAGTWTTVSGTGAFAGLSGSGAFTTALFLDDGSAATAFDGNIVPAPACGSLLLLGALATRRRRTRA